MVAFADNTSGRRRSMWHAVPDAETPASYYADEHVQARLREYCGGTHDRPPTAVHVATLDTDGQPCPTWERPWRVPGPQLPELLATGRDLARSLWDTDALLLFIDLDYQNSDLHGEPFVHPAEVFVKLEPTYLALRHVMARFALQPFVVMTGRGYHFMGRVSLGAPTIDALAALVPTTPGWHPDVARRHDSPHAPMLTARHARAAAGLGLLEEFLSHLVLRRASRTSLLPVVMNGTSVGYGGAAYAGAGRECVSIDISHRGDPLDVRYARIVFGTYQWHRVRPDIFGEASAVPPFVALPRREQTLQDLLWTRAQLRQARRVAADGNSAYIPDVAAAVGRLLNAYRCSRLAAFHRDYLAWTMRRPMKPPADPVDLPPCQRICLEHPNDLLLKPERLQLLTRGLLARGWHPAAIAARVAQAYETDHDWGDRWDRLHPRTRAEFDVRIFAGLVHTGVDQLVDFNCVSTQEKDLCPGLGCTHDLRLDRARLLKREPA
jgi:hypothetical protein